MQGAHRHATGLPVPPPLLQPWEVHSTAMVVLYIYILLKKKSSAEVSSRAGGTAPRSDVSLGCPRLCACLQWSWQGWGQGAVHRASLPGVETGSSLGSVVRSAGWCLLLGSWPALGARGMGALRGAVSGGWLHEAGMACKAGGDTVVPREGLGGRFAPQ